MQFVQENQKSEIIVRTASWSCGQTAFKWHKNCEIAIPLNHSCRFWSAGKIINAKKGDIVFFNSRSVHSFIIDEDETNISLIIFDLKSVLSSSIKFIPLKSHITSEEIDAIDGLREKLETLFDYAVQERLAHKTEDNPLMQSYISAFYLLLMRHFPEEDNVSGKKKLTEFYKIVDFINAHFKEKINISIIAQALYMSRGKTSALFSKYSNIELSEYIDKLRISNVNKLLSEGHSITEAALESGFQSIRTFNNTYKNLMGMSPTEYTKLNKE